MSDQFSANLRGAVDLSALRQPSTASAGSTAAANPSAATPQSSEPIAVASLISAMTETNLRYFLELSSKVVVLVDFYSTADESSVSLSAKLESLIDGFAGKVVLCRVDVAEQPRVAEAFGVTAPATLLAMMAGQPVPLFSGDQQLEKIQEIFEKLLVVAANNSVTGSVVVDPNVEPVASTPQLPPKHKAAVELLNAGSYAEAKSQYQQILNETPSDPIAAAGVAQCELLLRLEGVDVDKVLNTPPQNFADLLVAADALLAIGDYSDAFEALLVNFAEAVQEDKNLMRERLLQYFEIVGKSTPEVVAARNRLTSMLF
jgi:putative thioredoxin